MALKRPTTTHTLRGGSHGRCDYPRYSGANGKLAVKLGIAGKYSPSTTAALMRTSTCRNGPRFVAYLANNDHSPVGPKASISFTVK